MATIVERLNEALAGRYRIERELGAGGMATVYLAADLKHDRKVAIKVLKPELAAVLGAERFVVEIKTTASLQHPHILPLFDSGTADSFLFYVMPFIEGETIRTRLNRETQFGVDEAIRVAREVADALDYAHRHGVIHRDIKPENILLHDGRAMVMDFGIALAVSAAAGGRMTETGLSLGTPHYMSPEQATAEKEITARSDIYSLASVLYEMLAGDPPHTGGTAQAVIMKILTDTPRPVTDLRKSVAVHVSDAIAKALEKLPADRFESVRAFGDALNEPGFTHSVHSATRPRAARPGRKTTTLATAAVVLAIVAAAAGWLARGGSQPADAAPTRFAMSFGRASIDQPYLALSRDGRRILRRETDTNGVKRAIMHDLGTNTFAAIPGTENADAPEFSHDDQWIAFTNSDRLYKVPARGGPVTTLVDSIAIDDGLSWTAAGDIIFSGRGSGLWRFPANGGAPERLTDLDSARKDFGHWYPRVLPGDRAVIYCAYAERSRIEVYDFASKRKKILVENAVFPRYAPSGHLLYVRDAAIYAIAFDPRTLEVSGEAVPVQDDVAWEKTNALAGYDIAPNGTLVFLRDSEWWMRDELVWRDRAGRDTRVFDSAGAFVEPRVSPDGRWIAFTVTKPKLELFLYDVSRRVISQLSHAPASAFNANWMPDSKRIVYNYESPVYDIHMLTTDASAPDRAVRVSAMDKLPGSISADGKRLLYHEHTPDGRQLAIMPLEGDGKPEVLTPKGGDQRLAAFSPNGRWIAYTEFSGNRSDVYIRPLSSAGGRRLVSSNGGMEPRWTKGGRELVYIGGGDVMMSATVNPETGDISAPASLFRVPDIERSRNRTVYSYDVTPDGSRFLVSRRVDRPGVRPLNVVLNWRPGN